MSDAVQILENAKKLGLPEEDIAKITSISEKMNSTPKTETKQPRDLRLKQSELPRDLEDFQDALHKNSRNIKDLKQKITDTHDSIAEQRKKYREAFWIVNSKERKEKRSSIKKAIASSERSIESAQEQISEIEEQNKNIEYTIRLIKQEKANGSPKQDKSELEKIANSIRTQLQTKQLLDLIASSTIDPNNPKYAEVLKFYFDNKDKKPSLDNPLPLAPVNVRALMSEHILKSKTEKIQSAVQTRIISVRNDIKTKYTSKKQDLQRVLAQYLENKPDFTKNYGTTIINPVILRAMLMAQSRRANSPALLGPSVEVPTPTATSTTIQDQNEHTR